MKKVLYYHTLLTDDFAAWSSILLEQLSLMESSRLLDSLDELKVVCISPKGKWRDYFLDILLSYGRTNVEFVDAPYFSDRAMLQRMMDSKVSENHTYRKIYADCLKENQIVGYVHMKGITTCLGYHPADVVKRYYYWRKYLNWGGIEHWYDHVKKLETYDVSGVNYLTTPRPHYSGSFWWSKSEHIRKLPDPATRDWWQKIKDETDDAWFKVAPDRYKDEQWITCLDNTKAFNLFEAKVNPYETLLLPIDYRENEE